MIINDDNSIISVFVTPVITPNITPVITINGLGHLSDLEGLDDSIFLPESKCYSIFLHSELACHPLCSILYNTNQLISNNFYKDNHLAGCVCPMINFVLDLSTHACHQKDSKLVCFVSPHLVCVN